MVNVTAAAPSTEPRPSGLVRAQGWRDVWRLRDPAAEIVLYPRMLSETVLHEAERHCAFGPVFELRHALEVDAMGVQDTDDLFDALADGALRDQLRDDAVALAMLWSALTGRSRAVAKLEIVGTDRCTKLHADYIQLRGLCTYAGPGTLYVPSEEAVGAEPPLRQAAVGDVVFLKGVKWPSRGALHRSPRIQGSGMRRLLLTVDGG
ncbi:MAG: DUF1826 domain-containing protein [Myxococcota bacterium]